MTIFCEKCGLGGERRMAGSLLITRHLRPADHRFVAAGPRSAQESRTPAGSSNTLVVSPARLPARLATRSE